MSKDSNSKNPGFTDGSDLPSVKPSDYPDAPKTSPDRAEKTQKKDPA